MILAGRFFALARSAGIGELGDLRGHAAAGRARRSAPAVFHRVFGVVGCGQDRRVPLDSHEHAKAVAAPFEQCRRLHFVVELRLASCVVLDLPYDRIHGRSRNVDGSCPVVQLRVRYSRRFHFAHRDLAGDRLLAPTLRISKVEREERARVVGVPALDGGDVAVPPLQGGS